MPKIVDKQKRKRELALKSKELLLARNINDISIAEITKSIDIGKGTFYEYFANKEELYFTLVDILIYEHNKTLQKMLESSDDIRQKLIIFASFFYDDAFEELRKIYKTCKGLTLLEENEILKEFNTKHIKEYFSWFSSIIDDAIAKDELPKEAKMLAMPLFAMVNGVFIMAEASNMIENLQEEIEQMIESMMQLLPKDRDA